MFLFRFDTTAGLVGSLVVIVALPFAVMGALRIWPDTPVGRWLMLRDERAIQVDAEGEPVAPPVKPVPAEQRPKIGDVGKSVSPLRPVGTCVFGGRRFECLADGGVIGAGETVRVASVDGMQIKVRPHEMV